MASAPEDVSWVKVVVAEDHRIVEHGARRWSGLHDLDGALPRLGMTRPRRGGDDDAEIPCLVGDEQVAGLRGRNRMDGLERADETVEPRIEICRRELIAPREPCHQERR